MNKNKKNNGTANFLSSKLLWACIIFVLVPIIIEALSFIFNSVDTGSSVTKGDWLGFWGDYFGAILSGIVAFGIARYQVLSERAVNEETRIKNGLPYANLNFHFDSSQGGNRWYNLQYDFKSVDNNLLIQERKVKVIPLEDGRNPVCQYLDDNVGEKKNIIKVKDGTQILYEVNVYMFNGVRVFITNNNSEKELVHLFYQDSSNRWECYGVQPLTQSFEKAVELANDFSH